MTLRILRLRVTASLLLAGCMSVAWATTVTVTVKDAADAPTGNTVVIFDPLDAMPAPRRNSAVIDQVNKTFVPHVSVLRTGTVVTLRNSDSIRHEVYSTSPPLPFTVKLYASSHHEEVTFDKPGLVVLGCNIHDSMVAFVVVTDSPYFVKTGSTAGAQLDLPAGRYRARVWHPKLRVPVASRTITVANNPLTLGFDLDLDLGRETAPELPD